MSSYLTHLLKMRTDLDALIAAIQSGEDGAVATPARPITAGEPDAPKKRGRKPLSDEEKAARKSAKKAAAAIEAAGSGSEAAASTDSKPKRVMTDEHKAKLKAGREAAKARKNAEKAAEAAAAEANVPSVKREPLPAADASDSESE